MPPKFSIIIPLTKGYSTIVDSVDADLAKRKWRTFKHHSPYAIGNTPGGKKKTKTQYMHRIILARMMGRELLSKEQVDHTNGDSLDNRRCNLRLANNAQNNQNRSKRADNTSGYKGVCWIGDRNKWRAAIMINGKAIYLGFYDTPEAAYEAYKQAALKYHGEFARF